MTQLGGQFPKIPKIMVNCSGETTGLNAAWEKMAKKSGFTPIYAPNKIIQSSLANGEDLLHSDGGHWNPRGNKLFGDSLYQELNKLGVIDSLIKK